VVAPGLVEIARSGRIADAIAAAGGTTSLANLAAINLAAPLRDGEQIVVPSVMVAGPGDGVADGRVRLNTATARQLEEISGVGPVLAERIIAVRSELGGFESVEDLLDVPGIGEAKLAAMRDAVVVP
jgi:competence protein ComEA